MGPQIKKLMHDDEFTTKLKPLERKAWSSFIDVVEGFLGNHKIENYKEVVQHLNVVPSDGMQDVDQDACSLLTSRGV